MWTKIEDLENIVLNALPVYGDRYIKTKIRYVMIKFILTFVVYVFMWFMNWLMCLYKGLPLSFNRNLSVGNSMDLFFSFEKEKGEAIQH